jgi:UDP-N-acetylglucosamine 3-dehydrogenase
MLRVGVIGTGAMGVKHIRIYHEMEGVELVGISDIDEERVPRL